MRSRLQCERSLGLIGMMTTTHTSIAMENRSFCGESIQVGTNGKGAKVKPELQGSVLENKIIKPYGKSHYQL